ncbi:MAG: YncE family protein [Spirochaetaceae bacterium]|nr:YncE family protein [Spirochaetaceae bacterium]
MKLFYLFSFILILGACGNKVPPQPGQAEEGGAGGPGVLALDNESAGEENAKEEPAFPLRFSLKSAPQDAALFYNGSTLRALGAESSGQGLREFTLDAPGNLSIESPGYKSVSIPSFALAGFFKEGISGPLLEVKLEALEGPLSLALELATGRQPKSAYFSANGERLFVPLLDEAGIDVFRMSPAPAFEKRLTVPGSRARGFVEALVYEAERELWVSNMEDNHIHVFDLESLAYKTSFYSGGSMPKVLALSPDGLVAAVSNWLSRTVSFFDGNTKELLFTVPTGGTPRGMVFSADGTLLYTAIFDEPLIAVIDVNRRALTKRFRLYEGEGAARHVLRDGGRLYVSDMARGTVCILEEASGKLLRSVRVGPNINTIVLSPDRKTLFASSRGRNNREDYTKPGPDFGSVTMLSSSDLSVRGKVWGRNQPTGLAVSPNGRRLAFTDFLDANLELYELAQDETPEQKDGSGI